MPVSQQSDRASGIFESPEIPKLLTLRRANFRSEVSHAGTQLTAGILPFPLPLSAESTPPLSLITRL